MIERIKAGSNSSTCTSPAIICLESGNKVDVYRHFSIGDIIERSTLMSEQLSKHLNDKFVALFMTNTFDSLCLLLALEFVGASVVLFGANLKPSETLSLLDRARTPYIIVPAGIQLAEGSLPTTALVCQYDRYRVLRTEWTDVNRIREVTDQPSVCQLTSGSTSRSSKISIRSWPGIVGEAVAVASVLDMKREDVVLVNSAISHSYGLVGGIISSLLCQSLIVLPMSSLSDLDVIEKLHPNLLINLMFSVRNSYLWLSQQQQLANCINNKHLRMAMCAGAPLLADLGQALQDKHGIRLRANYGTTETGTITIDVVSDSTSVIGHPVPLGPLLPFFESRLEDITTSMSSGATGQSDAPRELWLRSPYSSLGYLGDNGDIRQAVDAEGWFHTKDAVSTTTTTALTRIDTLWYHHRIRMVNISSNNGNDDEEVVVDLNAIEGYILQKFGHHSSGGGVVKDVVLVDDNNTLTLHVVVVVADNIQIHDKATRTLPNQDDLLDHIRQCLDSLLLRFTHSKATIPTSVVFDAHLPYSPAGKLLLKYI
ncbi:hypothetical protein SAMD00019534_002660 [Acytostelium subglobosum LB1]|uniref:hypothetical protein n=1 Tax=Acytostelium subglobosum LB1 TaxID=1410327 RepID=UPI000644B569|nr:hypothetical protein SAMD00019534_002660 [Acytostelium subglobosum LB1]GAM17091.1 hypothetical protein SAMD00019534_002660 [Acytostelium subglobosum LB1]|eukprot:XP_012759153.1 hypothetical protein SAMD00019534_002660 [Acytostelium subglobosum LB1]